MSSGVWFTVIAVALSVVMVVFVFIEAKGGDATGPGVLYSDKHVSIYEDHLVLYGFYFGPFGRRSINFKKIAGIEILELNWITGKYRYQGTGDFRNWFAQDLNRSSKKYAFRILFPKGWWRVAFTSEDFDAVYSLLKERNLVIKDPIGA